MIKVLIYQDPSAAEGLLLYQLNEISDLVYFKLEFKTVSLDYGYYKSFQLGVKIPNLKPGKSRKSN